MERIPTARQSVEKHELLDKQQKPRETIFTSLHKSHSQTDPHAYQHHIIPPIMPTTKTTTRTTWVSRYQKGKTSLDLNEARAGGVLEYSDISWTICKQSAPRSRQITTPTPHQSIFTGWMLFLMPNQQSNN